MRTALAAGDAALGGRLVTLEAADLVQDARFAASDAADAAQGARLAALENADHALASRVDALELRLHTLELAVLTVKFNKVGDGGHYASYMVKGTGFLPGSTVISGVDLTAIVEDNGMFEIFGGNLFCDEQVMISGRDADNNVVTRSTPVVCNSEGSPAAATFTKVFDGGHYASYNVSGTGLLPGSIVTSGVGLTATVNGGGAFSGLFGGNLFCAEQVTVSGTDVNGVHVFRSAPVVCNSEGEN